MKLIKTSVLTIALAVFGFLAFAPVQSVSALDPLGDACSGNAASTAVCQSQDDDAGSLVGTIIGVLLFIIGIVSVIMIIVGAIMFVTSAGDAGRAAKARSTILYSVVGLIIALVAYAVVAWVLDLF